MTRKELFEEVVSRMEKPENKQRLEAQENNKNELSLQWHLNRARELFKPMEKSDEYKKSLMENDFDVSIREIQKLLDEQGITYMLQSYRAK